MKNSWESSPVGTWYVLAATSYCLLTLGSESRKELLNDRQCCLLSVVWCYWNHQTSQSSNRPSRKECKCRAMVWKVFYKISRNKKPNSWDVLGYNKKSPGCYFYFLWLSWSSLGHVGTQSSQPGGFSLVCGAWVGLVLQVSLPASQHVGSWSSDQGLNLCSLY